MLTVIRKGVATNISDGILCRVTGHDGWGMTPLSRLDERGPLQHGTTDRGFRLDPRLGRLVLFIKAGTMEELYEKRTDVIELFSPLAGPLSLRWDLSIVKQIDVLLVSDLTMPVTIKQGFTQEVIVTLKADDPTFYGPVADASGFQFGGGGEGMVIPMSVPHTVGASDINDSQVINYVGSWLSYPFIIRITGPATDPVLTNVSTGEKLDFTGATLAPGEFLDIDLRYGRKTIFNQAGVNSIALLTNDSDLATWHIAADPEVPGGVNSIHFQAGSVSELTNVQINYFTKYLGI